MHGINININSNKTKYFKPSSNTIIMETSAHKKYRWITDSLEDIARCIDGKSVLVGGTALAIFYLNHRVSVDIDLVPLEDEPDQAKEKLKGELSKAGYNILRTAFTNQFVIQFIDTGVKVELFIPQRHLGEPVIKKAGEEAIKVANLEDLLKMKEDAWLERGKARDLFDIVAILRRKGLNMKHAIELLKKKGLPEDVEELKTMVIDDAAYAEFEGVLKHAR